MNYHIPVLRDEVLEYLKPEPNQSFIDGTVGQGGHAEIILDCVTSVVRQNKSTETSAKAHLFVSRAPVDPTQSRITTFRRDRQPVQRKSATFSEVSTGRLLGFDRDERNLVVAKERLSRFGDAFVPVHDSYAHVKNHAYAHQFSLVNGVLLDLGFSSAHVDDPSRGFSFRSDGPLDMRYDVSSGQTAADVVNNASEDELARMFRVYGEENKAREIARAIVKRRRQTPFERTGDFAECVETVVPRKGKIHPATQVFQALRLVVNDELGELERALPDFVDLLASGGRLAIISFHSLEDRLVKTFMKERSDLMVLTKHVVTPNETEIKENPRSRSAKLRVAEKI